MDGLIKELEKAIKNSKVVYDFGWTSIRTETAEEILEILKNLRNQMDDGR